MHTTPSMGNDHSAKRPRHFCLSTVRPERSEAKSKGERNLGSTWPIRPRFDKLSTNGMGKRLLRTHGARALHFLAAQFGEELLDAVEALLQLRGRTGVGNAQGSRLAEGRARHRRDELVFQQRLAEVDVVLDRLAVVRLAK